MMVSSRLPRIERIVGWAAAVFLLFMVVALVGYCVFVYQPTHVSNDTTASTAVCQDGALTALKPERVFIRPGQSRKVSTGMDCGIVQGQAYVGCIKFSSDQNGGTFRGSEADPSIAYEDCDWPHTRGSFLPANSNLPGCGVARLIGEATVTLLGREKGTAEPRRSRAIGSRVQPKWWPFLAQPG